MILKPIHRVALALFVAACAYAMSITGEVMINADGMLSSTMGLLTVLLGAVSVLASFFVFYTYKEPEVMPGLLANG